MKEWIVENSVFVGCFVVGFVWSLFFGWYKDAQRKNEIQKWTNAYHEELGNRKSKDSYVDHCQKVIREKDKALEEKKERIKELEERINRINKITMEDEEAEDYSDA